MSLVDAQALRPRAVLVKDDKVGVTGEFCSSVQKLTPLEAGVEQ
jgi:hypothetical protein